MFENEPMNRFRPLHAIVLVLLAGALIYGADYYFLRGGGARADYERISPAPDGTVRIGVGDLGPSQVRFYRFLNTGNQEVMFFVGRDKDGNLQVAFDANELCAKLKRGYRHDGDWVVCNKCDKAFRLEEVNAGGGGCKPVPLVHRVEGSELVLTEGEILQGWRYFR